MSRTPGNLFLQAPSKGDLHGARASIGRPLSEEHASESKCTCAGSRKSAQPEVQKPSRAEVEAAVRTIIRWTGEDPERDGLIETPARVARSFEEFSQATVRTRLRSWKRPSRRSKATTK